jgi:hypothetical protein
MVKISKFPPIKRTHSHDGGGHRMSRLRLRFLTLMYSVCASLPAPSIFKSDMRVRKGARGIK